MTNETHNHEIDAKDQVVGRVATRVSTILQGKHRADFAPDQNQGDVVIVANAKDMRIDPKRLNSKVFYSHSRYPGGLKTMPLAELFEKDPEEVLRKAVWNMLPKNKLRAQAMKRLTFK